MLGTQSKGLEPLVLSRTPEIAPEFLLQEVLGADFYASVKAREVPGFQFGVLVAERAGQRVATVPYFVTDFKLNTMLESGWLKSKLGHTGFRIACVGHPCTPFGRIDGEVSAELMDLVFDVLKREAPVVSLKGFGSDLPAPGFVQVAGLPVAKLALRPQFWQSLSSARRRNLQRKRKKASALCLQVSEGLTEPMAKVVHGLYLQTLERSGIQFERLSMDYFVSTAWMSHYVVAYLGEQVVGFVQTIRKEKKLTALYIGIDNTYNREHGVYFALAMRVVDYAIAMECEEVELGETHYEFKRALGCKLEETYVYFRHRNPWVHRVMSWFSFVFEPSEDELR